MKAKNKLFIVSAPSGAGKSSLVSAVLATLGNQHVLERVITYTSRQPREGEREGVDYYFIAPGEFEAKIQKGFFIEWSAVYGSYYGTPQYIVEGLGLGKSYILVIDRVGAGQIIRSMPETVLIWITAPSLEVLCNRLRGRGTETEAQIMGRMNRAKIEINEEKKEPFYRYYVINDDFDATKLKIIFIILNELNGEVLSV